MNVLIELDLKQLKSDRLFLVVGMATNGKDWDDDHYRYLVEEHQCPYNLLQHVGLIAVMNSDGYVDGDRHGLFKFVAKCDNPLVKAIEKHDIVGDHPIGVDQSGDELEFSKLLKEWER